MQWSFLVPQQFEVPLTAIHQDAAEFGYEMCILGSILLIMKH